MTSSSVTIELNANFCSLLVQRCLLLRMLLVVDHRAVGVLFLVQLLLLRTCQVPAVGFNVGVFLLFNSAIVSAKLLRLLLGEFAALNALVDALALVLNPRIDLVASRMFVRKLPSSQIPVALCLDVHGPRAHCQYPCQKIAQRSNHLSLPNDHNVPLRQGILPNYGRNPLLLFICCSVYAGSFRAPLG